MEAPAAIEQVLSLGRRSSTYKLGLLRALVEYVIEQPAQEPRNGFHRIPLIEVARRVLVHYWRPVRLGLRQAKSGGAALPRAIATLAGEDVHVPGVSLEDPTSGLALGEWVQQAEELPKEVVAALLETRRVLIEQPLKYVHNLPGGRVGIFSLFTDGCPTSASYEEHRQAAPGKRAVKANTWLGLLEREGTHLVLSARSYEEISALRYWLRDAITLRWAQEVASYGEQDVPIEAFELVPLGRDNVLMGRVRQLYTDLGVKECLYSGSALAAGWHLDHVLPVSRFPVNLFWNLVPADPKLNLAKSDLLPRLDRDFRRRYTALMARCLEADEDLVAAQLRLTYRAYFQRVGPPVDERRVGDLWGLVDRNWGRLAEAGVGVWERVA